MSSICGCFYESDRGTQHLGLARVDARTSILSTAYTTKLSQTYVNQSGNQDCRYVFPLYDSVSVVAFECIVGSRVIRGVVKEKSEAKETFDKAVLKGETAGLLEQGPTADCFITNLGNIPQGTVQVNITYVGALQHDLETNSIKYTLPTHISPRYGHGSLETDMLSSHAQGISITVDITTSKECSLQGVSSPSHPISVSLGRASLHDTNYESHDPTEAFTDFSLGNAALDKDFILQIKSKDSGKPRALLEIHPTINGHRALMTTLVPNFTKDSPTLKPELIILCDQSGSMEGRRTETLVKALRVLLKSLPEGLLFNLVAFGSGTQFLWKKSHILDQNSIQTVEKFISGFNAGLGGTETLGAVQKVFESRKLEEDFSLILCTDGDIWQQDALFEYITAQVSSSEESIRVFPLGIGDSVSSSLIEGVARCSGTFAQSVGEGEKFEKKVLRILKGALTPDNGNLTMEVLYEKTRMMRNLRSCVLLTACAH